MKRITTFTFFIFIFIAFALPFLSECAFALKIPNGPFYAVKIKKSFKRAYFDLNQAVIAENFTVAAATPISKGLKMFGFKISKLEVLDLCNASIGYDLLKHDMNYAALMPCRIAIYKKGRHHVVIIAFLPSYFMHYFKNNKTTVKAALKATKKLIRIINSVKTGF